MTLLTFDAGSVPEPGTVGLADLFRAVPVWLTIGGTELLGWAEGDDVRGLPLSLPGIARWGLLSVREAATYGRSSYDLGEYGDVLLFKLTGSDLLVHSGLRDLTAQVPFNRLELAWADFARRVRALLLAHRERGAATPAWETWDLWERWLRGQEDAIRAESPRFGPWFVEREHLFASVDAIEA